jgi:hypothetical protein
MLNHLRNRGGALDFADTKTLLAERDTEWNVSEVPQLYFNRVEKAMRGLTRAGINSDLNECRDMVLFYLKATGEFDAAVRECLVGNVGNMSPICRRQPTISAKFCQQGDVATSTYFFFPFPRKKMSGNDDIS